MTAIVLPCSIVSGHRPEPLTLEAHHLIPVSWQLFWQPATAPFPGRDPDGRGMLWDSRTVRLCPTHHRNVHMLIVALMRQAGVSGVNMVPDMKVPRRQAAELGIAALGLHRLVAVGGSLLTLAAAGEWGEA